MIKEGNCLSLIDLGNQIFEVKFENKSESVNKFDSQTISELKETVEKVKTMSPKGVLFTSGKESFIVGADIKEFFGHFQKSDAELTQWLRDSQKIFDTIEDLNCPTISVINGFALGGGFEMCLSTTFRVAAEGAKVGQPEVKLGLIPGFGGTVRLSRLIGGDNAIEWVCQGSDFSADAALKVGAITAIGKKEKIKEIALEMIKDCLANKLDWKKHNLLKTQPLTLRSKVEHRMVFDGAMGFVLGQTKGKYPAPIEAISVMSLGADKNRNEALTIEAAGFVKMARTSEAKNLIGIFLADQYLKKENKTFSKKGKTPKRSAVLGAGIMGGGIAYQSASKGIPIVMKDIQPQALDLGMTEASQLLAKLVERKKIDLVTMSKTIASISPTLTYSDFDKIEYVVEAVVENENVKKKVIQEIEDKVTAQTIIASNTSTISITKLAQGMKHPERFCGLHFFNPVHKMPLVEVIRGKATSEETVATSVAYTLAMGKLPVVVNDCPGFLVNRVLFPYLLGFIQLVDEGVSFEHIDKVMERFGWPMGPAYLCDVVGLDTAQHAAEVMNQGFPDRMKFEQKNALKTMLESKRLGQKNGLGFYKYEKDKKGTPQKTKDDQAFKLLYTAAPKEMKDDEIVDRLMIPMMTESMRCLEEKIVNSPMEVDLALINGLGFPPFRGGIFRFIDSIGTQNLLKKCEQYLAKGQVYSAPTNLKTLAQKNDSFYGAIDKGGKL